MQGMGSFGRNVRLKCCVSRQHLCPIWLATCWFDIVFVERRRAAATPREILSSGSEAWCRIPATLAVILLGLRVLLDKRSVSNRVKHYKLKVAVGLLLSVAEVKTHEETTKAPLHEDTKLLSKTGKPSTLGRTVAGTFTALYDL